MPIKLKNAANADVVYTARQVSGDVATFVGPATSLLAKQKLVLQLTERANTNRIVGKLSIPTVMDCPDQCKVPQVSYTEVGSFDLAAVKFASSEDAADFFAQFASLVASDAVQNMFLSGTMPS